MYKILSSKTIIRSIFLLAGIIVASIVEAQTLKVTIKNIHTTKGQLCIAIFNNQEDFEQQKPIYTLYLSKENTTNGTMKVDIPFNAGNYGLSVLDDTNNNRKMDYHLLVIPAEGFGFSGYMSRGLSVPEYKNFSFYLEKNEHKEIVVLLRYI